MKPCTESPISVLEINTPAPSIEAIVNPKSASPSWLPDERFDAPKCLTHTPIQGHVQQTATSPRELFSREVSGIRPNNESGALYQYANPTPTHKPIAALDPVFALQHYRQGTGEPLTVNFKDVNLRTLKVQLEYPNMKHYAAVMAAQNIKELSLIRNISLPTVGFDAASLGWIRINLKGMLFLKPSRQWQFKGIIKGEKDFYNFNPSSHRGRVAEASTSIGGTIPGKPYELFFVGEQPYVDEGSY